MHRIEAVFNEYPQLFEGKEPNVYTEIPEGWVKFLQSFCDTVMMKIPAALLQDFSFAKISCATGYLDLHYWLPASLPPDDVHCLGAKALGMGNRASVGCVTCGRIVKTYTFVGGPPRCLLHLQ